MALPNKVTVLDKIQDGFKKVNETIDNIVTGVTYSNIDNKLTLYKYDNSNLETIINTNGLINGIETVSLSQNLNTTNLSTVPFSAQTLEEIYDYIYGIPYTIDMSNDSGKYFDLTLLPSQYQSFYQLNQFCLITLLDRNVDGDSFYIKINTQNTKPTKISSNTETYLLNNNTLYLFSYDANNSVWISNKIISDSYTQEYENINYFIQSTPYAITGFTVNAPNYTSSTINSTSPENYTYEIGQDGNFIINFDTNPLKIFLPDANLFENKSIEITDISPTTSPNNSNVSIRKIYSRFNNNIKTISNFGNINYITLNQQNNRYVKFISNGTDWILTEPYDLFRAPSDLDVKFVSQYTPASNYYTATTSSNSGKYYFTNNHVFYNFEIKGNVQTSGVTYDAQDIKIMLPYVCSADSNFNSGLKNVYFAISGATTDTILSMDADVTFQGTNEPSILKLIKTNFPSKTYYTWGDIGTQDFVLKGSISYGVSQVANNYFKMNLNQDDILTEYTNKYF